MARMSKADKLIEDQVHAAFSRHGNCVQIPMMKLSPLLEAGRIAGKAGESIEDAIIAAIAEYRV